MGKASHHWSWEQALAPARISGQPCKGQEARAVILIQGGGEKLQVLPSHSWHFHLTPGTSSFTSPARYWSVSPGSSIFSLVVLSSHLCCLHLSLCSHLIPGAWISAFLFPFHHRHLHLPIPVCIPPSLFPFPQSCFHFTIAICTSLLFPSPSWHSYPILILPSPSWHFHLHPGSSLSLPVFAPHP